MITHDESRWNLSNRAGITIILDVLSDVYHPVAQFQAYLVDLGHNWVQKWGQKIEIPGMTPDHSQTILGVIRDHLGSPGTIPDASWMIPRIFKNSSKNQHFHHKIIMGTPNILDMYPWVSPGIIR